MDEACLPSTVRHRTTCLDPKQGIFRSACELLTVGSQQASKLGMDITLRGRFFQLCRRFSPELKSLPCSRTVTGKLLKKPTVRT